MESEDTAILVEKRDPPALAAAIHRMLHEVELCGKMAERAKEVALTRYSPAAYRRSLGSLYAPLLER